MNVKYLPVPVRTVDYSFVLTVDETSGDSGLRSMRVRMGDQNEEQ